MQTAGKGSTDTCNIVGLGSPAAQSRKELEDAGRVDKYSFRFADAKLVDVDGTVTDTWSGNTILEREHAKKACGANDTVKATQTWWLEAYNAERLHQGWEPSTGSLLGDLRAALWRDHICRVQYLEDKMQEPREMGMAQQARDVLKARDKKARYTAELLRLESGYLSSWISPFPYMRAVYLKGWLKMQKEPVAAGGTQTGTWTRNSPVRRSCRIAPFPLTTGPTTPPAATKANDSKPLRDPIHACSVSLLKQTGALKDALFMCAV